MVKLGTSLMAWLVSAGAALLLAGGIALIAGTMGLLEPSVAHAAQPLPSSQWTPPIVPWLMQTQVDPTGSGRTLTYLRIVHTSAKPLVRANPTLHAQSGIAPPDLTDGHTGSRAGASH